MTAIRQEAIQMLERVPEDKLSFVIQIGVCETCERASRVSQTPIKVYRYD